MYAICRNERIFLKKNEKMFDIVLKHGILRVTIKLLDRNTDSHITKSDR